jgi:hypothetical protein
LALLAELMPSSAIAHRSIRTIIQLSRSGDAAEPILAG